MTWGKSITSLVYYHPSLIDCREILHRDNAFSLHPELLLFHPHPQPCFTQAGGVTSLIIAFGEKSTVFLDGGTLAFSTPGFLSSFSARVSHPLDSVLVVPPPGSPPGVPAFRPGASTLLKDTKATSAELFSAPSPALPIRTWKSGLSLFPQSLAPACA